MARKPKVIGTHTDSNVTRAKQKEEAAKEFKDALPKFNLNEIPSSLFLRNEEIYKLIIEQFSKLGVTHLIEIDKFALVSLANTFDLLNEAEKVISRDGLQQVLITREGATKIIPNPMISQRNTLLNTLNTQLKNLQLDPTSRRELIGKVSNELSNLEINELDENLINTLLRGVV
ncbi:P27 family phage terminase small subunit [Priestia endophytica]|uniref:P27 family phage terminase small subunit n=1 Tax=Priestia endophytica TaxID=135735 RepID=UPI00124D3DBD|nr:P27 family phage terminase small subunit [Priestia endophytica]KAB2489978.1 P27 family phage terminase small subunit [Priestia endophytica]